MHETKDNHPQVVVSNNTGTKHTLYTGNTIIFATKSPVPFLQTQHTRHYAAAALGRAQFELSDVQPVVVVDVL